MARKKGRKARQREEAERKLRETRRAKERKLAIVALCIAALVVLAILMPRAPPDYVTCGSAGHENLAQHFHPWIFVQIGDSTGFGAKSLTLPEYTENMGIEQACMYPIHRHEGSGTRGAYFILLHVESTYPRSEHAFTLGDFFEAWGEWYSGLGFEFGPDGVSTWDSNGKNRLDYLGPTEVRTARNVDNQDVNAPWNDAYGWVSHPASRGIVLEDGVFVHVWVHGDF